MGDFPSGRKNPWEILENSLKIHLKCPGKKNLCPKKTKFT
jgi:hypothetical protein